MDKGTLILQTIQLLQEYAPPKRLPLYHYVLDYTLTAIFLTCYGYGIYLLINWLWA